LKTAVLTLSDNGARIANKLASTLPDVDLYFHDIVTLKTERARRFKRIVQLTKEIFDKYEALIYIAPCGVVVRSIDGHIKHKTKDPAVVVVDLVGRFAISLLGGHEAGANRLTLTISNIIGAEPVVTTSTEAVKSIIVGVGCRRGIESEEIISAITESLTEANVKIGDVRLIASVDIKSDEAGLLEAADKLGIPLRFIPSDDIRSSAKEFTHSLFVQEKVNLPAVSEPSALLAGRRTQLILPKKKFKGVTVAIAKENFL